MATAVAVEPEAQCQHPSRTPSNRPGREVCDDCKQPFESGLPVKAYSEAPPPVPVTTAKPPVTEAPSINKKSAKAKKSTALENVSESDLLDQTQKTDEDKLSSSIATMPADELHKEIIQTYVALGENALMYQALVLDARRRMKDGEKVGGYTTWGEYADCYLKRQDESLPSCLRRLRRALEGKNPDTKHRNHRKKSNRKILEESLDQNERLVRNATESGYKKGFADGEKAGEKKMKMLAAKLVADQKKKAQKTDDDKPSSSSMPTPAVPPTTDTDNTFHVVHRPADNKFRSLHNEWIDGIEYADHIRIYPTSNVTLFNYLQNAAKTHFIKDRTPIDQLRVLKVVVTYDLLDVTQEVMPAKSE